MPKKKWTFITSYGYVLGYIAAHKTASGLDISNFVGVNERQVRKIIYDLESEGYISHKRVGRSNLYKINPGLPMRHESGQDIEVDELLKLLVSGKKKKMKYSRSTSCL